MTSTDARQDANDASFARLREHFARICDLPREQQDEEVAQVRTDDAVLAEELEQMLAADRGGEHALDGAVRSAGLVDPGGLAGTRVGGYELLGELGRGGMGVVHEALQQRPRRRVAVKLIRPGFVTEELLARFTKEAEVLGALNHPGIAAVFEAGTATTEAGELPFIAMELVEGQRADEFVRGRGRDLRATLELVARIADAVEHAHERGVVHRDLKPGNVLVDAAGAPKVLDFGVARVLDATATEAGSAMTRTGQLVGTLAYMSPEQVAQGGGDTIDARTDVYALGVLAYELLSGRRPLDVEGRSLPDAARAIEGEEPTTLGQLDARLRGDVEVMVARAMAKEPARRYPSAGDLAADLRRHLAGAPVTARPASRIYRMRRFTARHRGLVLGLTATFLAMAIGTTASLWQLGRAREAQQRADGERRVAQVEALRGTLAAAQGALEAGDVNAARRALDRVTPDRRRWEWGVVRGRLDGADRVLEPSGGGWAKVTRGGDVLRPSMAMNGRRFLKRVSSGAAVLEQLPGEGRSIMALSPSATTIGLVDGSTLFLRDLAAEAAVATVDLPEPPSAIAVADDGAAWSARCGAAILVARTGQAPRVLDVPRDASAPRLNGPGTLLGWLEPGSGDLSCRVFDLSTGRFTLSRGRDVAAFALSPSAAHVATAGVGGVVRIRDLESGGVIERLGFEADRVRAVAYAPDGRHLAAVGAGGAVAVWNLGPGGMRRPERSVSGHGVVLPDATFSFLGGAAEDVSFSTRGGRLAVTDEQHRVHVFELPSARVRFEGVGPDSRVVSLAVAGQAGLAVAGEADGGLRFIDTDAGRTFLAVESERGAARRLAATDDGAWIASVHRARNLAVRSLARPLESMWIDAGVERIVDLAFAASGESVRLLVLGETGRLVVLDAATGALQGEGQVPSGTNARLAVSGDRGLVVCSGGGGAAVVEVDGLRERWRWDEAGEELRSVCWLAEDRLALGDDQGVVHLVSLDEDVRTERLATGGGAILSLSVSPDGERLAAGTTEGWIQTWDLATRRLTLEMRAGDGAVHAVAHVVDEVSDAAQLYCAATSVLGVLDGRAPERRRAAQARFSRRAAALGDRARAAFAGRHRPDAVAGHLAGTSLAQEDWRALLSWTLRPPLPSGEGEGGPPPGTALRFSGIEDRVAVGDDASLRMGDAFTIEAWIRPGVDSGPGRPVRVLASKEGEYILALWGEGDLRWIVAHEGGWPESWTSTGFVPPVEEWTHVALVREGAMISVFLNGRLVQRRRGPEVLGDHHGSLDELWIGGRQHTPSAFVGDIDEVRVWAVARGGAEIRDGMGRTPASDAPGLVGSWSFDEGAGDGAADLIGRSPGSVHGAGWVDVGR